MQRIGELEREINAVYKVNARLVLEKVLHYDHPRSLPRTVPFEYRITLITLQRDLERSVEVAIKEKLDAEKSFIEYKFSSERSECGFVRPNFASIGVWVNRAIFRAQESDERRTWTLVSTRRFRRYIGTVQFEI